MALIRIADEHVMRAVEIFSEIDADDLADAFAVVRTDSPLARIFAYASVVDNRSGDPIYIPAAVEVE